MFDLFLNGLDFEQLSLNKLALMDNESQNRKRMLSGPE
jgi:hypothetical protein